MTERDPNFTSSHEQQRLLRRALGQDIPQFLARFGKTHAIQRVKARKTRPIPKTLFPLERRPRSHRSQRKEQHEPPK
jgi:hypothetical protein